MHASETNDANPDGVLREQTKEEQWQALLEQLRVKAIANPGPVAPPLIMGICACYTCLARIVRNFGLSQCDCAPLAWRWLCVQARWARWMWISCFASNLTRLLNELRRATVGHAFTTRVASMVGRGCTERLECGCQLLQMYGQ